MDHFSTFNYERHIAEFRDLQLKSQNIFNENQIRYSGIDTIDNLIQCFDMNKCYTLISNKGMGVLSIVSSIFENFNLIYDENFSTDEHLFNLNSDKTVKSKPQTWFLNYFELPETLTMRKDHQQRPVLNHVPKEIRDQSDVIIAIYRPEYYEIETWEDGTSTENQIEISLLKNHTADLGIQKLTINKSTRRVKSLPEPSFFQQWVKKFEEFMERESD